MKGKEGGRGQEIANFKAELPKLTPQQAGQKWATMALESIKMQSYGFEELMVVLPAPTSWPAIQSTLEQKGAKVELQFFGALLNGDRAKQAKCMAEMTKLPAANSMIWKTALNFAIMWQDGDLANKAIDKIVSLGNSALSQGGEAGMSRRGPEYAEEFPDLTLAFGNEKASVMMLRILKTAKFPLEFQGSTARKIALDLSRKHGSTFAIHHCEFVTDLASADLYPLFSQWFPKSTGQLKVQARSVFIFSKVLAGNGDQYLKEANLLVGSNAYSSPGKEFSELLGRPEYAKQAWGFFEKALRADPKIDLWQYFGVASFAADKIDQAIPVFRLGLAAPAKKDSYSKTIIFEYLVRAVAVKGTADDVVKEVLKGVEGGYSSAQTVVSLGKVLNRPDLVSKGLDIARKDPNENTASLLIKEGMYAEAEKILASVPAERSYMAAPTTLLGLYAKMGRHQDVIDLLDLSPDWVVSDLKELGGSPYSGYGNNGEVVFNAAAAFIATGKKELGVKALQAALDADPTNDDAYDLLVKTAGDTVATKILDEMYAHDQFEERPVIWKAIIQQRAGNLDAAEKLARLAISIDPSDGNMGKDKRMLAYKVLSEILAK